MTTNQDELNARGTEWQLLAEFSLSHEAEDESRLAELITQAARGLALSGAQLERLKIVLSDAAHKAIHRSGSLQPSSSVVISVFMLSDALEDSHQGVAADGPGEQIAEYSAKEAGKSGPYSVRGWGYFLIDRMMDSPGDLGRVPRRAVELYLYPEGGERGARPGRSSPSQ